MVRKRQSKKIKLSRVEDFVLSHIVHPKQFSINDIAWAMQTSKMAIRQMIKRLNVRIRAEGISLNDIKPHRVFNHQSTLISRTKSNLAANTPAPIKTLSSPEISKEQSKQDVPTSFTVSLGGYVDEPKAEVA